MSFGTAVVFLPLSWHIGRARDEAAYTSGAVLDTCLLYKIVVIGVEALEYFKDAQFLVKHFHKVKSMFHKARKLNHMAKYWFSKQNH